VIGLPLQVMPDTVQLRTASNASVLNVSVPEVLIVSVITWGFVPSISVGLV